MTEFEKLTETATEERLYLERADSGYSFIAKIGEDYLIVLDKEHTMTEKEKTTVLAHELGHYFTCTLHTVGESELICARYERRARYWSVRRLVPLKKLLNALNSGVTTLYALSELFCCTEELLKPRFNFISLTGLWRHHVK